VLGTLEIEVGLSIDGSVYLQCCDGRVQGQWQSAWLDTHIEHAETAMFTSSVAAEFTVSTR
jgi:hypothetical protein